MVTKSNAGAKNVSYEGVRCGTFEFRRYAYGHRNGKWVMSKNEDWRLINFHAANRPRAVLVQEFLEAPNVDPLLASLYGGLLGGVGVGLVIKMGSSTGGMDIPPLIIHRLTGFDVSKAVMIIDALTVGFGLWIYVYSQAFGYLIFRDQPH